MSFVYAESSGVLAWLLGEPEGESVAGELAAAEAVISSSLTLVECERCLIRAVATGAAPEAVAIDRRAALRRAAVHWHLVRVEDEVTERASRPFPVEPVRTLDALHLATALLLRSAMPDLRVLTLDRRVRDNARSLGLSVAPESD